MARADDDAVIAAIEGGLPALLLLAAFLWWWIDTALRIRRGNLPPERLGTAVAAVAVTAMVMAESLVDYPLRTPLLGCVFVIGCVEMIRVRTRVAPEARKRVR